MEDASKGIFNGSKTPAASIVTLLVTAEDINSEGSKLYRQGNFEAAAASFSEALKRLDDSAGFHDANKAGERSRERSKYYANRAQARMQLHDFEMAAVDYRASIDEDPRNAKALIWWGRCEEALGRWDEALKRFESASALLRHGNNLLRIALEGGRRARANRDTDRKVAHAESMPQELVHHGQMLRLSFREPVPTKCCLGEWFSLSLGLSNEFGLWRRNDFGRTASPKEEEKDTGDDDRASSPSPGEFPISEAAREWGHRAGTEDESSTASDRLRLIVEARDLEGFGGRSLATQPRGSPRGTENGTSIKALDVSSPPLVDLPRSTGGITAASVGHRASSLPAFDEGRYLAVEIESNEGGKVRDIGPEGKTALRARFVAVSESCSNCLNGDGDSVKTKASSVIHPSFVPRLTISNQPRLVLLRVSVLEDDARSLLGRCVVPVLSLPIAVHEVGEGTGTGTYRKDPTTANTLPTTAVENETLPAVSEQTTFAVDASKAGAIGCREAIVPVARSLTFSSVMSRWQRERSDRSCGVASFLSSAASSSDCNGNTGGSLGYSDGCGRVHASGEVVVLVAESPGQLGIGGKVWDSAFVLCDYLATTPTSVSDASAVITAPVVTVAAESPSSEIPNRGTCANGSHATSRARGHGAPEVTTGALTFPQASGMVRLMPTRVEDVSANRSVANSEPLVEHTLGFDGAGATNTAGAHRPSFMGSLVQGKRVLELGAGTGLVSICCSLLGATAVVATDFEGVTELIKVNVALNFSEAASQPPSTLIENGLPSALTSTELPRRGQRAYSAGGKWPNLVDHKLCAVREAETSGGSGGSGDSSLSWKSRQELVQRSQAPVVAVPLVWGERSAVVEAFDPEIVVMSDVVYDPSGYEPLLQTLLEIMRPKMIAIMAHRHRHPEDHVFFERLCQLFHVMEEKSVPQGGCAQQKHTSPASKVEAGGRRFEGADVRIFRIWHRVSP